VRYEKSQISSFSYPHPGRDLPVSQQHHDIGHRLDFPLFCGSADIFLFSKALFQDKSTRDHQKKVSDPQEALRENRNPLSKIHSRSFLLEKNRKACYYIIVCA